MTKRKSNKSFSIFSRWFIAIFVLCSAGESVAQDGVPLDTIPKRKDYSKKNFEVAIALYQIESLKNGVLLVRLQTKQKAIDHFISIGNDDAANRVKQKQEDVNAQIISAFKKSYDFTNVYFFSSEYSNQVRAHKLDSVPFIDKHIVDKRNRDPTNMTFLTAELTTLEADTATARFNSYDYDGKEKGSASVSSNMGISALIFKSDQFVQLSDPFPYYVRGYTGFLQKLFGINKNIRKLSKIVAKANGYLKRFSIYEDWRSVERTEFALPPADDGEIRNPDDKKVDGD